MGNLWDNLFNTQRRNVGANANNPTDGLVQVVRDRTENFRDEGRGQSQRGADYGVVPVEGEGRDPLEIWLNEWGGDGRDMVAQREKQ